MGDLSVVVQRRPEALRLSLAGLHPALDPPLKSLVYCPSSDLLDLEDLHFFMDSAYNILILLGEAIFRLGTFFLGEPENGLFHENVAAALLCLAPGEQNKSQIPLLYLEGLSLSLFKSQVK